MAADVKEGRILHLTFFGYEVIVEALIYIFDATQGNRNLISFLLFVH